MLPFWTTENLLILVFSQYPSGQSVHIQLDSYVTQSVSNWLTSQAQRVLVNGATSEWQVVTSGGLQGSIFTSVLFNILLVSWTEDLEEYKVCQQHHIGESCQIPSGQRGPAKRPWEIREMGNDKPSIRGLARKTARFYAWNGETLAGCVVETGEWVAGEKHCLKRAGGPAQWQIECKSAVPWQPGGPGVS